MELKTYIDLFAGIGGFHQAFKEYNERCVFASEINPKAVETYIANHGIKPLGDITKINSDNIPPHDILCGGFPCQSFSLAGLGGGFDDPRGLMFFEIARIVKHHHPKVLFLENVRNLKSHDGGKTFKTILEILSELGYDVYYEILNTSRYGLPHQRRRIFMVCFRKDLNVKRFYFPPPLNEKISLMEYLEDNQNSVKPLEYKITIINNYKPRKGFSGLYNLPNKAVLIGFIKKPRQSTKVYSIYGHAVCLCSSTGGWGAATGLYLIDEKARNLTPRECARIQGYPDSFKLHPIYKENYIQFGNSVSVNVVSAIIRQIHKAVKCI